ncbi:hypothetical protein STVA_23670 [Allostella vacuolata]|nr:hypothetical protein STVA_23670 [Stella vacuolata]
MAAGMMAVAITGAARPAAADFVVTFKNQSGFIMRGLVEYSAKNQPPMSKWTTHFTLGFSESISIPETIDGQDVEIDMVYVQYTDGTWWELCRYDLHSRRNFGVTLKGVPGSYTCEYDHGR